MANTNEFSISKLVMPTIQILAFIGAFYTLGSNISSDIQPISIKMERMAENINDIKIDIAVISTSGKLRGKRIIRLEKKMEKFNDRFNEEYRHANK